jgi:choline transport protein
VFAAATNPAIIANLITGMAVFNHESYEPKRWHTAMIMWCFIIISLIFNIWFRRVLNTLESIGGVVHVVFFFINIITLTVLAQRSTNDYVWKTLTHNVSGWTNPAVSWGLGLLTMTGAISGKQKLHLESYGLLTFVGADGLLHMSTAANKSKAFQR